MLKSAAQFIQRSRITTSGTITRVHIGCSGWQVPGSLAAEFPGDGTQLQRYSRQLQVVEISSSFYRAHAPETWRRWRRETPENFRFAVKVPRHITHRQRLRRPDELEPFLALVRNLEYKLGPLLFQLPPGMRFDKNRTRVFFNQLRQLYSGPVVCDARHPSWLGHGAEDILQAFRIARAATHPRRYPGGGQPGGWSGLHYIRLHGHPKPFYSSYDPGFLEELEERLAALARDADTWCIFNNTASDAGLRNALTLNARLANRAAA